MAVSMEPINGGYALSGSLSFATVKNLFEQSINTTENAATIIDLAKVEKIDSAGVALLVEWARRANAANGRIKLENVSAQGLRLINVANLKNLFSVHTDW